MKISNEEYKFFLEQYRNAGKNRNYTEAILLNNKLYEETLFHYRELIAWKEHEGESKLSDEGLRRIDNSLRASLIILNQLLDDGISLSSDYPQELNNPEENN